MYQVYFYAPLDHYKKVSEAMFIASGGDFKLYDKCAFSTFGKGQFRAKKGAQPFIGTEEELVVIDEVKVEMLVKNEHLKNVIEAMLAVHPYEEVAYGILKLENFLEEV